LNELCKLCNISNRSTKKAPRETQPRGLLHGGRYGSQRARDAGSSIRGLHSPIARVPPAPPVIAAPRARPTTDCALNSQVRLTPHPRGCNHERRARARVGSTMATACAQCAACAASFDRCPCLMLVFAHRASLNAFVIECFRGDVLTPGRSIIHRLHHHLRQDGLHHV
jgi:hypothetical protein